MISKLGVGEYSDATPLIVASLTRVGNRMSDLDLISAFVQTLESIHGALCKGIQTNQFRDVPRIFELVDPGIVNQFLQTSFPAMAQDMLAYMGSHTEVEYLTTGIAREVRFTVSDVYILVAMSFVGIPLTRPSGDTTLRDGTCIYLFSNRPKQVAKLTCLLNYFNVIVAARKNLLSSEVCDKILNRQIILERLVLPKTHGAEWWMNECNQRMSNITYMEKYKCIESAHDAVQADFANKHIGGGVLRTGCVQEEIRFIISPECLVSVFLCAPLADNEALLIRNTLQVSSYTGYSQSFKCTGFSRGIKALFSDPVSSMLQLDDIICIDATPYTSSDERSRQFTVHAILRELEKCRCGLSYSGQKPFATGNWGCGVFGGDAQLKAIIQWLAASAGSRDLLYFPFDDTSTNMLPHLSRVAKDLGVKEVFRMLLECISDSRERADLIGSLIERIRQRNSNHIS